MNIERLTHLAEALEADAVNPEGVKFSLFGWLSPSAEQGRLYQYQSQLPDVKSLSISCGTQACAMGLACLLPAFQAQGLSIEPRQELGSWMMVPVFEGCISFSAAAKFFEINLSQATLLFHPVNYELTKGAEAELAVAKRIRNLIATQTYE